MSSQPLRRAILFLFFFVASACFAGELPDSFPTDVPIADYMNVASVTQVKDDLMVDLQAPNKELGEVVAWFRSGLAAEGWETEGETVNDRRAILAFKKGSRRCGVMVNDFVLSPSMETDATTKGISLQISGGEEPTSGAASGSAAGAMEATDEVAPR